MRKKLEFLILAFCLCLSAGCATNPISGRSQLMLIDEDEDLAIGQKYAPEIEKELGGRIPNDRLQNYLDHVGQNIARVSHRSDWQYQFVALEDKMVNAFALPGGYIFITRGMLENLETEAQLAGILAHETVHVVARHSSAAMSRQIGISILLSAVTSEASSGVATIANMTNQIIGLKFSRDDEVEADMGGLDYTVKAGYNPYGLVETMQMLEDQSESRPIEFLSTHPNPGNRVKYMTEKIQKDYFDHASLKIGKEDYQTLVLDQLGK